MLLDSNIIIYASKPGHAFLHPLVAQPDVCVSVISCVETLGWHQLTEPERQFLTEFFANVDVVPVSDTVVHHAIRLRQTRRMRLGDALIAGTALASGTQLVTRNVKDFDWVPGLSLLNPFP